MFSRLDASRFRHSGTFYHAEFESLLAKIIACYGLMISDGVSLKDDENSIRDVMHLQYLNNNDVRRALQLTNYSFNREVPEDFSVGRTDIKVESANTFIDTAAYFTIECKRLGATNPNGKTGLNAKYIANGIQRFVSGTYSCHYRVNGMIGFITEPVDIGHNVTSINKLLTGTFAGVSTVRPLEFRELSTGFEYSYCSAHGSPNGQVTIYHLMLDFSNNIEKS